ncbi:MAG TPA: hypothetical protein VFG59_02855, partial [Anaeromyxobacter sp.]|nr:hypothetical protein [Anaeromyxobacter sp.]
PTCNQTDPSCQADLSQLGSGSPIIQLDPIVHACESSSSCPPSCSPSGVDCTFESPGVGTYTLLVVDPTATPLYGTLEVAGDGSAATCP